MDHTLRGNSQLIGITLRAKKAPTIGYHCCHCIVAFSLFFTR